MPVYITTHPEDFYPELGLSAAGAPLQLPCELQKWKKPSVDTMNLFFEAFDGRKVDIKRFQWLGVRLLYEANGDARYISSKRRRIKSSDSNATNFRTQDLLTPPSPARRNPVCSAANLFHLQIYEASNPPLTLMRNPSTFCICRKETWCIYMNTPFDGHWEKGL